MGEQFLVDGSGAMGTFLLAHGAGAGMDSDFMAMMAADLAARGLKVVRFDFPYMALKREDGKRHPPDRMPKLLEAFRAAIDACPSVGPLFIGGKSMGGRVASLLAAEVPDIAAGLICLGYPFHPPKAPEKLRTAHFADIRLPSLILQGERDAFGTAAEAPGYGLPTTCTLVPVPDGDHDFSPRKQSGHTSESNRALAAKTILEFVSAIRL